MEIIRKITPLIILILSFSLSAKHIQHERPSNFLIIEITLIGDFSYPAKGPFGQLLSSNETVENPYKFNTKYTDSETDLVYYGYRYYDSNNGRWLNQDPIGVNGGINAYNSISNDLVNGFAGEFGWSGGMKIFENSFAYYFGVDSYGKNEIIVAGGINDPKRNPKDKIHDQNWKHFITASEIMIKMRLKKLPKDEVIEWHVEYTTYLARGESSLESLSVNGIKRDILRKSKYIDEIRRIAKSFKGKVKLIFYSNKKELIEHLNKDFTSAHETEGLALTNGKNRNGNSSLSKFYYFGHGMPGALMLTIPGFEEYYKITNEDIESGLLLKSSFTENCVCKSFACNTATPIYDKKEEKVIGPSFAEVWRKNLGNMRGVIGRSDYGPTAELGRRERFNGSSRVPILPIMGKQNWGPNLGQGSFWEIIKK